MFKKSICLLLLVSVLLILGFETALAAPWGGKAARGWFGPSWLSRGILNTLDLTEEQKESLKALEEKTFDELFGINQELMRKTWELRRLWAEDAPDEEKINAKNAEITALRLRLSETLKRSQEQLNNILTPEQQAKLKETRGSFFSKRQGFGRLGKPGLGCYGGRWHRGPWF